MYISLIYTPLVLVSVIISLGLSPIKCELRRLIHQRSEWPCEPIEIPNAIVKYRRGNKIAKIRCEFGYVIIGGYRKITCIRAKWRGTIPHCITSGCEDVSVENGRIARLYSGALVHFTCDPGYQLQGSPAAFCDGTRWNTTTPNCTIPEEKPDHTYCNFEYRSICGWMQDHLEDFNWKRSSGIMNGITGSLGPKTDHTLKKSYGHYISVYTDENWQVGKIARIFSPIIAVPKETPACVTLWYHMNGRTTDLLKVYFKPEAMPLEVLYPRYLLKGGHGDAWNLVVIHMDDLGDDLFQVVLEAVGGQGHQSDIAVDDFKVLSGTACIEIELEHATNTHQYTEISPITSKIAGPTTTEEQIVRFVTTLYPRNITRRLSTLWSTAPAIRTTPDYSSSSTQPPSSTRRTYYTFTPYRRPSTSSLSTTIMRQTFDIPTYFSSKAPSNSQSETRTNSASTYTTEESTRITSIHMSTSTKPHPTAVVQTTTITAFTEPKMLSFEGTDKGSFEATGQRSFEATGRRSFAAPILVAVLGLATIAAVLTVYWVKRKQQTNMYEYADFTAETVRIDSDEPPCQRDTSNYVQLGDDSLVHIGFE